MITQVLLSELTDIELVLRCQEHGHDDDRPFQELMNRYQALIWRVCYSSLHNPQDAEDLTQAFFARFLEKNYLEGLDSEKGRFRAFLLAAFKHFLANEWDRERALKRGGGHRIKGARRPLRFCLENLKVEVESDPLCPRS